MATVVRRNEEKSRYEIVVDDVVAGFTEFRPRDGVMEFPHTEVDEAYSGRGLAGRLVGAALDDVRSRDEKIKPVCPYVARYIEKHPEYTSLVD